jgi:aspartyl-tRNA(Asn)/glutamyl-tRNA(Gln) amidotransferase subunit C
MSNDNKKHFNIDTIKHLADLSQVELSENEQVKLSLELNVIIDAVSKVSELDLSNVAPLNNPIELENVYRDDEIKKGLSTEEALKNAPEQQDNQFKTSKIL